MRDENPRGLPEDHAQAFYCSSCWAYRGPTGKRVDHDADDVIVWITCSWCTERRSREAEEEEERRRREEERSRPRACALEGCGQSFTPGADHQLYCCDEHRWKAHRAVRRVNGHGPLSRVKR